MIIRKLSKIKKIPASHEDQQNPGCLKRIIFKKEEIPENYRIQMINWAVIPEKRSFRPHYHTDMYEIFILIKGKARISVDKKTFNLVQGDTVLISPNSVHSMANTGDSVLEYYVIGLSGSLKGKTVNLE